MNIEVWKFILYNVYYINLKKDKIMFKKKQDLEFLLSLNEKKNRGVLCKISLSFVCWSTESFFF
jgi:hypothetical protein